MSACGRRARQEPRSIDPGRSAHRALRLVKVPVAGLDTPDMNPGLPTRSGFLGRIAAALSALTRYAGCTLQHNPLPEIREVGHEWRASA
jgi:hypothetical protein